MVDDEFSIVVEIARELARRIQLVEIDARRAIWRLSNPFPGRVECGATSAREWNRRTSLPSSLGDKSRAATRLLVLASPRTERENDSVCSGRL